MTVADEPTTIREARDRARVTLQGTVETLAVRRRKHAPWLEAGFGDGTGRVVLVWMGRDAIPGIEAGRRLVVRGRISAADGVRRLYNPHYELL